MLTWKDFSESEKMTRASQIVSELTEAGLIPTGKLLGDRIGTTDRTGRTYLQKVLAVNTTPASSAKLELPKKFKKRSTRHIVVMPDVQVPLHDRGLVAKFIKFVHDYQPDGLGQVGDFTDSTQLGRWVEGQREQYDGNLQRDFDISMDILREIRRGYSGPFKMSRSNHDDRLYLKIKRAAPELESLRDLTIENQLRLAEFDVSFHHELVDIAPGWIMGHGDEGRASMVPGQTAYKLAEQTGMNVVCGHTHRLGIYTTSHGYNGVTKLTRQGMEVGNFMDLRQATYLKGGKANWQSGFGILHVTQSGITYPETVPVVGGNFVVDGKEY